MSGSPLPRTATRGIAALIAVSVIVACAPTHPPPIGSPPGNATPEGDEGRLWLAAQQAEEYVVPAATVYDERGLQAYVEQLAARLTPDSYLAARGEVPRVRLRKDPRLSAAALSDGTLVVHTGLVARAANEAQLAGVLAHEIAHVTHRHHVREARAIQNGRTATDLVGFLGILATTAAAVGQAHPDDDATSEAIARSASPLLSLGLNLSFAAMVSGYRRELEREADQEGMRLMAGAGYDPRQLATLFRTIRDEAGERGQLEAFFWGDGPRLSERIETVERLAPQYPATPTPAIAPGAEFDRRVQWIRVTNSQYDAFLGRVALARAQIARAADAVPSGFRPVASEVFGGLMWGAAARGVRTRLNDERMADEVMTSAMTSLERATALAAPRSPVLADVHRIKGVMIYDWWEPGPKRCEAKPALETYLTLRPDASDREAIQAKIADLSLC